MLIGLPRRSPALRALGTERRRDTGPGTRLCSLDDGGHATLRNGQKVGQAGASVNMGTRPVGEGPVTSHEFAFAVG